MNVQIKGGRILSLNGRRVIQRSVPHHGGRWATHRPCGIVFHYTAGCGSDLTGVFTDRNVSAHFSVDREGTVYQYVPLGRIAWHADNANGFYVGIEHTALPGRCDLTDEQLKASAALSAAIVQWAKRRRGVDIPLRKVDGPALVPGFHDHADGDGQSWNFSRHTDRLYGWTWERYLRRVQAYVTPYELYDATKIQFRRFASMDEALQAVRKRVGAGRVIRLRDLRKEAS
ncbi:MAG TPA: peptidoglycan recognition family protein [Vicinamibacterales bacterium]|nr:peptidoglycan recognition family protein [Vicinamibacterales bacterium]